MSPSPRITEKKTDPATLWMKSSHTSHYVFECSSGKEHSMRALSKAFLLSLIRNEDSLTSIITAIPALVWVGKTDGMPPTTASYQLWSHCVHAKAKSTENSGATGGPIPLPEGAHPTTQPPDTGRDARSAACGDMLQPASPRSCGPTPHCLLPPYSSLALHLRRGVNKMQGCFSRPFSFQKKKKNSINK